MTKLDFTALKSVSGGSRTYNSNGNVKGNGNVVNNGAGSAIGINSSVNASNKNTKIG